MKNLVLAIVMIFVGATAFAHHLGTEPEMNPAMDTMVQDFEEISVSDLPEAVTTAVANDYPSATIDKAYKNESDQYKLEISTEDGATATLYADAEGNWIQI